MHIIYVRCFSGSEIELTDILSPTASIYIQLWSKKLSYTNIEIPITWPAISVVFLFSCYQLSAIMFSFDKSIKPSDILSFVVQYFHWNSDFSRDHVTSIYVFIYICKWQPFWQRLYVYIYTKNRKKSIASRWLNNLSLLFWKKSVITH